MNDNEAFVGDEDLDSSSEQLYERHRIVADKGQSLVRVDKFLCDRIENVSRNQIQKAAEIGRAHV